MEEEAVSVAEVLERIRTRLIRQIESEPNLNPGADQPVPGQQANIGRLRGLLSEVQALHTQVGVLNPRPSGVLNDLIQLFKKALLRILRWYSRPVVLYEAVTIQFLGQVIEILERDETRLQSLEGKVGLMADDLADLRQRTLEKLDEIGTEVKKMGRERR
jgi:hypothetical protein